MSNYVAWSSYNTSRYAICNPVPVGTRLISENEDEQWVEVLLKEIEEEEIKKRRCSELYDKIELVESENIDCTGHSVALKTPSVIQQNYKASTRSNSYFSKNHHDFEDEERFFNPRKNDDIKGENSETFHSEFDEYSPEDPEYVHETNCEIQECPSKVSFGQANPFNRLLT